MTVGLQWIRGLSDGGESIRSLHQVLRSSYAEGFSDRSMNITGQCPDFKATWRAARELSSS